MNREIKATLPVARSVFAAAAAFAMPSFAGFIDGLATHYAGSSARRTNPAVVPAHA